MIEDSVKWPLLDPPRSTWEGPPPPSSYHLHRHLSETETTEDERVAFYASKSDEETGGGPDEVRRGHWYIPREPGTGVVGGNATRDRVTWTKWRGTGEVRLVHGLRDKEPQEIPIPPYSPAQRELIFTPNILALISFTKTGKSIFLEMVKYPPPSTGVDVTSVRQCASCRDCERAFMGPLTREPTKTSIHRNVDTPMAFPHPPLLWFTYRRGSPVSCRDHYVAKPSPYRDSVKHYSSRAVLGAMEFRNTRTKFGQGSLLPLSSRGDNPTQVELTLWNKLAGRRQKAVMIRGRRTKEREYRLDGRGKREKKRNERAEKRDEGGMAANCLN
ncbi:hypothetical protein DBV15_04142 [Temnothorax longispinosus]|uniref:Uncharacterized protein n=1 Tax=Temnothorax longispinosus TaxID=300112 RepID=A0A4S2L248_9HYME|nr:hypothetical protein DBV15_04142 [Temnothorax longispinosus]